MKIAVFGLGYVGCVSLGCLASQGHRLIGVDVNEFKVDLINNGKPTIIEKDIEELIAKHWKDGKIKATTDHQSAVLESDLAFICVGTPPLPAGQLDLTHVFQTAEQISEGLKLKGSFYTIVIRSTVMPGTNKKVRGIIEEKSEKKQNTDFAVVSNPEFLREGTAIDDFFNPGLTVVGSDNEEAYNSLVHLYKMINAPLIKTDIEVAEMIKYVNNSFHALKIAFTNEVAVVAKSLGVDAVSLMNLFKSDNKLNISAAYLKPGMSYGGSCLPKDLKGLNAIAYDNYLNTPLLRSISESNQVHNNRAFDLIEEFGAKKVGILGLAFKNGTDDLRNSPAVELTEKLSGKGYRVMIYDKNVQLSKLLGANKSYIEEKLPHISGLLSASLEEVINHSETIVLVHKLAEISEFGDRLKNKNIIDLEGYEDLRKFPHYKGIAW